MNNSPVTRMKAMRPAGKTPTGTIKTQKQLAELAGLSDVTIYNALYRKHLVKQATLDKIYALMKAHDYHPDGVARAMVRGKTNIIGIILPNFEVAYYAKLASAIERFFNGNNYHCIICQHHDDPAGESREIDMMREFRVDGIILRNCGLDTDDEQVRRLSKAGIPFVLLDGRTKGFDKYYIGSDDRSGAANAIELFISNGHRRIAYVGYHRSGNYRHSDRYRGYADALRKHGLELDPKLTEPCKTEYGSGKEEILEILRRCGNHPPTAVFGFNDSTALGMIAGLNAAGRDCGKDVAVIGCGGYLDHGLFPFTLSTVVQDIDELANQAAGYLLAQINGQSHQGGPILVPCGLFTGTTV